MIFYFLSGYWLWKLINIFYYCDYVTVTQCHCIMIGQQKNNRDLHHQNCHLTEKSLFKIQMHIRIILKFLKNTNDQVLHFFFPPELQIHF